MEVHICIACMHNIYAKHYTHNIICIYVYIYTYIDVHVRVYVYVYITAKTSVLQLESLDTNLPDISDRFPRYLTYWKRKFSILDRSYFVVLKS